MERGFYSASAGLFTQQRTINVLSNNVANVNTAGFKSQATVESSFADYLIARVSTRAHIANNDIGAGSYITITDDHVTDFSQGSLDQTERTLDMAIQGSGFFVISNPNFGQVLTRNGQFEIDGGGNLILPGVGNVLNQNNQVINVGTSTIAVDASGNITIDGQAQGSLAIVNVQNAQDLTPVGDGFFQAANGFAQVAPGQFQVAQGYLEKSNTDMSREMSALIAKQNQYNSCSQMLKIYDRIQEISANQVGKVG